MNIIVQIYLIKLSLFCLSLLSFYIFPGSFVHTPRIPHNLLSVFTPTTLWNDEHGHSGGGVYGSGGNSGSGGGGSATGHHHNLHHHSLGGTHHRLHHHATHLNQGGSAGEGDSLNIIPLKGSQLGGSDVNPSAGGILGSIMGASQQASNGSSNSGSSPHIVANHGGNGGGAGRLSLPLPLTACHRCDVCGKLLSTKLTLKRHKEQQHLQPLNNAVCNLCHKVFRTLNSLNNHKSIYHRRQKQHHHSGSSPGSNGGGGGSGTGNTSGGLGGPIGSSASNLHHHQQQFQLHQSQALALNALTASAVAAAIEENAVRTAAAAGAVTPTGISAAKSEFKSEYL